MSVQSECMMKESSREQFAETEANQGSLEPEEVSNLEADVEAAHEWLDIDEMGCSIKMTTQLTAITEYVM